MWVNTSIYIYVYIHMWIANTKQASKSEAKERRQTKPQNQASKSKRHRVKARAAIESEAEAQTTKAHNTTKHQQPTKRLGGAGWGMWKRRPGTIFLVCRRENGQSVAVVVRPDRQKQVSPNLVAKAELATRSSSLMERQSCLANLRRTRHRGHVRQRGTTVEQACSSPAD